MDLLQNFLIACIFSFIGSIPPGTLNVTILQLGLNQKLKIAWRFALAAALVEYPYAWLAVVFESYITSSTGIIDNFKLISSLVMVVVGVFNLWAAHRPSALAKKFQSSGFRRGIVLSILNPLALPFWIAITAYLKVQGWISLSNNPQLHMYLLGVSAGALGLLLLVAYTAKYMIPLFQSNARVKYIPGSVLLLLGLYGFMEYVLEKL
jgi:threonine/homoserine/homoserine lactone efflux protein